MRFRHASENHTLPSDPTCATPAETTGSRGADAASAGGDSSVKFTRSLAHALVEESIRVNAVASGPIWNPLIPATFPSNKVAQFGSDVPLRSACQPSEVAPSYVLLASQDSSYITGQVLHPNGGESING
jgi:NAD(P)-dependent dehydrogenase (short-subunit alcohol dehydrogenase family)